MCARTSGERPFAFGDEPSADRFGQSRQSTLLGFIFAPAFSGLDRDGLQADGGEVIRAGAHIHRPRDVRELEHEGAIPGAFHAPRGMLEFWADPESPYHKPVFGDESKEFVLFCGAGWRSALATKALQDMGMTNVAHIDGGFADWVKQGAPVETLAQRQAKKSA